MSKDFAIFLSMFIIARSLNRSCDIMLLKDVSLSLSLLKLLSQTAEVAGTISAISIRCLMFGIGENKLFTRKWSYNCVRSGSETAWFVLQIMKDGSFCIHYFDFNFILVFGSSVKFKKLRFEKQSQFWIDEKMSSNRRLLSHTSNSNTFFNIRLNSSTGLSVYSKSRAECFLCLLRE